MSAPNISCESRANVVSHTKCNHWVGEEAFFTLLSDPHSLHLWCSWGPTPWLSWKCFLEIQNGSNEGNCNVIIHFSILRGIGKTKLIVSKKHLNVSEVLFRLTTIRVLVISSLQLLSEVS